MRGREFGHGAATLTSGAMSANGATRRRPVSIR